MDEYIDEYIYCTWARPEKLWVREMLTAWEASAKPLLSFPWIKFDVHTLFSPPFWLYMYYAKGRTTVQSLAGRMEYRLRVVGWQKASNFRGPDIYLARQNEDGKVWFLCDAYEEVRTTTGNLLSLDDFAHPQGKKLASAMRTSIPLAICIRDVRVLRRYSPREG